MPALDYVLTAGAAAGAVAAVAGLLWWLVAPRVRDYMETIVLESLQANHAQLARITDRLETHGQRLAVLTADLQRLDHRDRLPARHGPVELVELADLLEAMRHRPHTPDPADLRPLEKEEPHL